jgi:hypothetical protein
VQIIKPSMLNTEECLHDLGLERDFFNDTKSNNHKRKAGEFNFINIKFFCSLTSTIKRIKI